MTNLTETVLGFVMGLFLAFVLINWVLGCETWDERYWTDQNSCMTPAQMFGLD